MPEAFDLEAVYDEQIEPLMAQIIDICKAHKLPVFATFLYANDAGNEDPMCCTTNVLFVDDRPVPKHIIGLLASIIPKSKPSIRIQSHRADGSVATDTIIL